MANMKKKPKLTVSNVGKDTVGLELSYTAGGKAKGTTTVENNLADS